VRSFPERAGGIKLGSRGESWWGRVGGAEFVGVGVGGELVQVVQFILD